MIERNLQFVTVRKYGSAFLEAFGMLPLTYFGAVGDNQTDNYANIQVAINESIKRGLNYIFVPNGTYLYKGTLVDVDKITFIGNSKYAKIYDGENEIRIYQICTQMPWNKGTEDIDTNVEEDGYIDIPISMQNPIETILVVHQINGIDKDIYYITDTLISKNGTILNANNNTLVDNVRITDIKIINAVIRIYYTLTQGATTIEFGAEWRVR